MKRKTPAGVWALRGVTVAVAVVVIVVVGTVAYSAYEDYTGIRSSLAGGANQAPVTITGFSNGSESVVVEVPIPNRGLYTLNVSLSCTYPTSNVVCTPGSVSVPPGGEETLHFVMFVANAQQFLGSSNRTINGTVAIAMEPFATVSAVTDLGGFVESS